jgi:hypothetical protein
MKQFKLRPSEADIEQLRQRGVDVSELEQAVKEWDEAVAQRTHQYKEKE